MKESDFLKLNFKDLIHGLLMAILVPVFGVVQQSLSIGSLTFDWQHIKALALAGGLGYLFKKFMEGGKTDA